MITDNQTNYLYLADSLRRYFPGFYARFQKLLSASNINYSLLPATKDIWAVDYMPIQVNENKFVQFVYKPDYLKTPEDIATISDTDAIGKEIGVSCINSTIILDGGNVVKGENLVLMCDKIFRENAHISKDSLEVELLNLFEVERIVFIPTDPSDMIGHADGVTRFVDDKTVLINTCDQKSAEERSYQAKLKKALNDAGLNAIEIPYNPYINKNYFEANGIYMNYLQMENVIVLPVFNRREDELAVQQFEDIFARYTIRTIESNAIARDGGILNCITWNIKK